MLLCSVIKLGLTLCLFQFSLSQSNSRTGCLLPDVFLGINIMIKWFFFPAQVACFICMAPYRTCIGVPQSPISRPFGPLPPALCPFLLSPTASIFTGNLTSLVYVGWSFCCAQVRPRFINTLSPFQQWFNRLHFKPVLLALLFSKLSVLSCT